jgi:hypothetical protein
MSLLFALVPSVLAQDVPDAEAVEREPVDPALLELAPTWLTPPDPDAEVEPQVEDPDAPPPRFTVVPVPGLEVEVNIPDAPDGVLQPWGWTVGDATMDTRLGMRNSARYTNVVFTGTTYQPDIASLSDEVVRQILPLEDEDYEITVGSVQRFDLAELDLEGAPELGDVLVVNAHIWDTWLERDLWSQSVLFAVEGAAVLVRTESTESLETADEVLGGVVMGMVQVLEPALPVEELPFGKLETEAGYTIELPPGWRALTDKESPYTSRIPGDGPFAGGLSHLVVVDPAQLAKQIFECSADQGTPLEILSPEKSELAAGNFKTVAEIGLKGGKYMLAANGEEHFIDVDTSLPFYVDKPEELRFVGLGPERDGYLWRVGGQAFEEPLKASVFYTAYSDIGLMCTAIATPEDEALLGTFDATVEKVTISAEHPMPLSLRAQYKRWWPWSNPLLQLYWVPVPFIFLAGWLVTKDDD